MIRKGDDYPPEKDWIITDNLHDLLCVPVKTGPQKFIFDLNLGDISPKEMKLLEGSKNEIFLVNKIGKDEINPFELSDLILTFNDRKKLFDLFIETKPNLMIPLKHLGCACHQMTPENRKAYDLAVKYNWKINPEIVYGILAFEFKAQKKLWIKWLYPKKNKETKKE